MSLYYTPPPIQMISQTEEVRPLSAKPFFYEYDGRILNLAAATKFYVDHIPFTSLYWPCAKIGGNSYQLSNSMKSEIEALEFLRNLTKKITEINI